MPNTDPGSLTPQKIPEDFEELQIPQVGTSPITGIEGTINWGAYNKPTQFSRWSIGDSDADEMINWIPLLGSLMQVPNQGPVIATLPTASLVWIREEFLNGADFLLCLGSNGTIYQVSVPGGAIVVVGTGFTTIGTVGMANWQGTQIMISDSIQQKVFSWNGSVLTTVFASQPVSAIRVFSGRLWLFFKSTVTWTNATTNNSFSGDSGSYVVTDDNCGNPIIGGYDVPGALFIWGSNWIKSISGLVDTTGAQPVLTFTQVTLNGQIAPLTPDSIILVGNIVYFCNVSGVYAIQGTNIVQISSPQMNGLFSNISQTLSSFSMSYGKIQNNDCLFVHVYYLGDRNVPAGYTVLGFIIPQQQWFRYAQGVVTFISGTVSEAQTNNVAVVWGTDGTNLFSLFTDTTTSLTSQWNSKLWDFGSKLDFDNVIGVSFIFIVIGATTARVIQIDETLQPQIDSTQSLNPSVGLWINNFNVQGQWVNNFGVDGSWQGLVSQSYFLAQYNSFGRCRCFAVNLMLTGAQTSLISVVVQYKHTESGKGT